MKIEDLNSLILEYVMTQDDMVKFYSDMKSDEECFKKKPLKLKYKIAEKDSVVDTYIGGKKETSNKTKKGDYIIHGIAGELYVLSPEKVKERYTIVDDETVKTKPVKITAKLYKGKELQFVASWGEKMILQNGDYLVRKGEEYYRIEKNVFTELYEPC